MLKRLNKLEKQHGGAIPFSAMNQIEKKENKTNKTKRTKRKKSPQKPKKQKKRSISPSRAHRKATKKLKRSKKTKKPKNDKKCKCGSHKYTGKEETPRGLGKCEECLPLNVVLKGKDGKLYENRKEGWFKLN